MASHHKAKIVTDGLILYLDAANSKSYPGSGNNWYDLSGQNNHGTFLNSSVYDPSYCGSIVFDGATDKVTINPSGVLGGTSICFWVKGNLTGTRQALFSGMIDDNIIHFDTLGKIGSGSTTVAGNSTTIGGYDNGNWYHVAVIKNDTNNYSYIINGINKSGGSSTEWKLTNQTLIGASVTNLPFNGKISNIQVYNRILSLSEVVQNYNALKSRYGL